MKRLKAPEPSVTSERPQEERPIEVGQWYWLTTTNGDDEEETVLTCVVHVGSNFVKLESANRASWRVHIKNFDQETRFEPNPNDYIQAQIARHRENVTGLLNDVKQLTAKLGITHVALPEGPQDAGASSTALAVAHGIKNVHAHKTALIKAKEKTLPDLFKRIEEEHEDMATWMKATLVPMKAQADGMKKSCEAIEQQIFIVELYAGLIEELELIRKGNPAPNETKIHLMQRRHYMDEECLVDYRAGGMEFKDIGAFERWLLRKKSRRERVFPHTRCVVVFRVRRKCKERETPTDLGGFISLMRLEDSDKATFLYIRNGEQYYRLQTGIDFGEQLFPDKERSVALGGGEVWVQLFGGRVQEIVPASEVEFIHRDYEEKLAKYEKDKKKWKRMTKAQRKGKCSPYRPSEPFYNYAKATPESVYYDDAMRMVAHEMLKHNRVAVVLQGLLDRSPAFHPHPPWQLWTSEGFLCGIELVYDLSRALTDGDPPSFRAFQLRLNMALKKGSFTVGQEDAWERDEGHKERRRRESDWRHRGETWRLKYYRPYGNPGPGLVAEVTRFGRKRQCGFTWQRERQSFRWVSNPDEPGWNKRDDSTITTHFTCSDEVLLNVSAYTPGEYLQFYADPRTRADYLQWAPMLLAAEDWHAAQKKEKKPK